MDDTSQPAIHRTGVAAASESRPRYQRAWRRLESPARMMALTHVASSLDTDEPPGALCLVGRAHLTRAQRIGLFAGSYNPVTLAHVALAEAARSQAKLDLLAWTMAEVTVDKERVTRAALPDRLAQLLALALPRHDAVVLMNRGLYVDQAHVLRCLTSAGTRLFILVGYDKIVQILDPRYYADREAALTELFGLAELLVAPRADAGEDELRVLLDQPENRAYAGRITALRVASEHRYDSATAARRLAAQPSPDPSALARLLPPEGLALVATGAYQIDESAPDTYTIRQHWLAALSSLPAAQLRRLPTLNVLISRSIQAVRAGAPLAAAPLAAALADAAAWNDPAAARAALSLAGVALTDA
jgi:nicotinamide-nucleotide adenylyltransferase